MRGLAKKLLIANPLGTVVDQIFELPSSEMSFQLAWAYSMSFDRLFWTGTTPR